MSALMSRDRVQTPDLEETAHEAPEPLSGAEQPPARPGRRQLFSLGALTAGMFGARQTAYAQNTSDYDPTTSWKSPNLRLARRITNGLYPDEVDLALSMSYEDYLEYRLNDYALDDSVVENFLKQYYPAVFLKPPDLYAQYANNVGTARDQFTQAYVYRALYSSRQLYQRMVEFWTHHFSQDINKTGLLQLGDDRDVNRAYAVGNFGDLVWASAHSPSMLHYLDNDASPKANPNQNYARELLELHTLGADNGYSQQDVIEVARCFTGYTYINQGGNPQRGYFNFNSGNHDQGAKIVLGETIPANGGQADAERVLEILAAHPNTAGYIAYKMCRWFLSHTPDPNVVQAAANAYLSTNGDITSMLRVILSKNNIMSAPAKYKQPYLYALSTLRGSGAVIGNMGTVVNITSNLGQRPFYWATPDGWPDNVTYWVGYVMPRWTYTFKLLNNEYGAGNLKVDTPDLESMNTAQEVADTLDYWFYGGEMPASEKSALISFMLPDKPTKQKVRDAVALAMSSPNFMWY